MSKIDCCANCDHLTDAAKCGNKEGPHTGKKVSPANHSCQCIKK